VEVTVKKLRKPAIVYKTAPSGNSELAGRKIEVWQVLPSVGYKNAFAVICKLSEYFPSSFDMKRNDVVAMTTKVH